MTHPLILRCCVTELILKEPGNVLSPATFVGHSHANLVGNSDIAKTMENEKKTKS